MSDAPEMLDARLYVFEGQNFVSEKDYRVAMRNYSIRDADADRLQAQVDRMTVELYRAREAGRREGLEEGQARIDGLLKILERKDKELAAHEFPHGGAMSECFYREVFWSGVTAVFCSTMWIAVIRLVTLNRDSPKAEGEEPSDNYVAWLQFRKGSIRVCDSDAEGAFRVYRHPKEATLEKP